MVDSITENLQLVSTDEGKGFKLLNEPNSHVYIPDFSSSAMEFKINDERRRRGKLLKAIEGKASGEPLKVFDFFGGFAQDAFLMACLGHEVLSVERNPLVYEVTSQAWENQKEVEWVKDLNLSLRLKNAESFHELQNQMESFDVIYMDPMFEKSKNKSKSVLSMQILQELLSHSEEEQIPWDEILELGLQKASKIVMKLPIKGPSLVQRKFSHQILGKTIRFEVFI